MKSLYMRWARRGSNSEEWMSTQTDGCFSRKSSGSSVYGIRWNHISFTARSRFNSQPQPVPGPRRNQPPPALSDGPCPAFGSDSDSLAPLAALAGRGLGEGGVAFRFDRQQ